MKRLIILGLLLFLVACNVPDEPSDKMDSIKTDNELETAENETDNESEAEPEDKSGKETENPETTIESKDVEADEKEEKAEIEATDKSKEVAEEKEERKEPEASQEAEERPEVEKNEADDAILSEAEFKKLTRIIIEAQIDQDFNKIGNMSTKDVVIDEDKKTLSFKNVTYPHEQEILTAETATAVEYRYYHPEDDKIVIVGYAAYDDVNDYSYTIDFTFLLEDGEWKMNDMDRNK